MRARDLLDRTSITDVWIALGGAELRHGRGKAFWRDGDGDSVSLNQDNNVFFDFVAGTGGGVLVLIETVLGCDRREAVRWLASHLNVTLDGDRPLTPAQKRDYAIRRAAAERKARELTEWRRARLRRLRGERNRLYISENGASAIARILDRRGRRGQASLGRHLGARLRRSTGR